MARWGVWSSLLVGCALTWSCKSEDESPPVAEDQLASKFAQVKCDSLARCCASAQFPFDSTNCEGQTAARLQKLLDQQKLAATRYSADAAGECVAKLKELSKCGSFPQLDIPVCQRIFVGTLEPGQACNFDDQCKPPGYCDVLSQVEPGQTPQGMCRVDAGTSFNVTPGKTGDACSGSCHDNICDDFFGPNGDPVQPGAGATVVACYKEDGVFCAFSDGAASPTCQPLARVGGACNSGASCAEGLFCVGSDGLSNSGVCTAPHPNGADCGSDFECQSNFCSDGVCATESVTAQECANGGL